MKNKMPILWTLRRIRRRIPAIVLMCAAYVGQTLLSVYFALGTRNVIDCTVDGRSQEFIGACLKLGQ